MEPSYLYEWSPLRSSSITLRRPSEVLRLGPDPGQKPLQGKPVREEHLARRRLWYLWRWRRDCRSHLLRLPFHSLVLGTHWLALWRNRQGDGAMENLLPPPPPRFRRPLPIPWYIVMLLGDLEHRRDVVFRGLQPDHGRLVAACREAARLRACCIPKKSNALLRSCQRILPM